MSEEKALETEDDIQIEETEEAIKAQQLAEEAAEEAEVEIIVEGEEKPASKSQVPYGIRKRFNKLNGKIDAANTVADEAQRRAEMLAEENKLLRLQAQSVKPTSRPDEDDFETRAEYLTALDGYDTDRIAKVAQEQVAQIVQKTQTQTTQINQDAKLEEKLGEHYERANALKMKNYEELEDKAIDVLGNDLSKTIMANTEKSHLIMAHLGANPAKAEELVSMVKTNPVGALVKAVEIGNGLSIKPKLTPPDPETKLDPGSAASDWQSKLDAARDKATQSGKMDELISLKKQAKEAGVTLR